MSGSLKRSTSFCAACGTRRHAGRAASAGSPLRMRCTARTDALRPAACGVPAAAAASAAGAAVVAAAAALAAATSSAGAPRCGAGGGEPVAVCAQCARAQGTHTLRLATRTRSIVLRRRLPEKGGA
jgi:hypothetical protein